MGKAGGWSAVGKTATPGLVSTRGGALGNRIAAGLADVERTTSAGRGLRAVGGPDHGARSGGAAWPVVKAAGAAGASGITIPGEKSGAGATRGPAQRGGRRSGVAGRETQNQPSDKPVAPASQTIQEGVRVRGTRSAVESEHTAALASGALIPESVKLASRNTGTHAHMAYSSHM